VGKHFLRSTAAQVFWKRCNNLHDRSEIMRTSRIARPVGAVLLLGVVPGCSENNELDPGTFTARLSGARTEALSGSAVAGVVFSDQGVSYTINMLDQGDEFVFLTVLCPGEEAPAPGNHPLGTVESDCSASYRRTVNDPFTTIEQADAVSGSLVVRDSERGVIAGSLDFTGPLVAGETQEGALTGSATFDAELIAAGGRSFHASPRPTDWAVRSQTRSPVLR